MTSPPGGPGAHGRDVHSRARTGEAARPPAATAERGGPPPVTRARTTAQEVVASLALPVPRPASSQPASPLPPAGLHRLPRDASMLYAIGRVDDSGRVACGEIASELGWRPGTRLDVIVTPRAVAIRAAPGGLLPAPRRPCIVLPAHARRPHGIRPGDSVLVAAAPGHGLVLVYPLSALDDMISRYHSPEREAGHRHEP